MGDEQTPEVVCLGETMIMLVPEDARPISARARLAMRAGGAESNVATTLARLGHRARWLSVLGEDPFGRIILDHLGAAGVDTSHVTITATAPTALYAKDPRGESTRVHYYRRGSAASRMDTSLLERPAAEGARIVHLSGITPALSESCRRLVHTIVEGRPFGPAEVSFDVNYRPGLWPVSEAAEELAALARRADTVFVGRDEAETLWGTKTPDDVRDFLPEPPTLVVKDGAVGATSYGATGTAWEEALPVEVVESVGAGDAFAAGWLSGRLRGLAPHTSLRLGHLMASRALGIIGDCPDVPPPDEITRMLRQGEETR